MKLKLSISSDEKAQLLKSAVTSTSSQVVDATLESISAPRKVLKRNRGYKPTFRRAS